jgi:hypothetical protein
MCKIEEHMGEECGMHEKKEKCIEVYGLKY